MSKITLANLEEVNAVSARVISLETAMPNKVDKVNGKGLSTNDYSNAEKTKLEGLSNYDDTEIKADITEINSDIAEIGADINKIQATNKKQTADIANLKALAKGQLYREDTDSDATDSKEVPAGAMPYATLDMVGGMSRKGKNLFDISVFEGNTKDGITFSNNSITGTWNRSSQYNTGWGEYTSSTPLLKSGNYTYSINYKSTVDKVIGIYLLNSSGSIKFIGSDASTGSVKSFTINEDIYSYAFVVSNMTQGQAVNITDIQIQIEQGSSATSFEPYTDKLIDAKVDKVVSVGKNLLTEENRKHCTISPDGTELTESNRLCSDYIKILTTNYTASITDNNESFGLVGIAYYNNNKNYISRDVGNNVLKLTSSNIPSSASYMKFFCQYSKIDAEKDKFSDFNIMLEQGSTATDYSPYSNIEKPIPQSVIDLCPDYGIGINSDCYNYIDFAEKKYHHRVGSSDMGSVEYLYQGNGMFTRHYGFANRKPNNILLCSKYKTVINAWTEEGISQDGSSRNIAIKDTSYTDATTFKNAMNGVKLYYELETEEIIDLSEVLAEDSDVLEVEASGTISLHYPAKDNGYTVDVPNKETYLIKLEEAVANG